MKEMQPAKTGFLLAMLVISLAAFGQRPYKLNSNMQPDTITYKLVKRWQPYTVYSFASPRNQSYFMNFAFSPNLPIDRYSPNGLYQHYFDLNSYHGPFNPHYSAIDAGFALFNTIISWEKNVKPITFPEEGEKGAKALLRPEKPSGRKIQ